MSCIFCGRDDELTDEHVFPAFMGGTLTVPKGSCERCNRYFSRLEGRLKKDTRPLLNLMKIRNRDGIVPNVPVDASIRDLDMQNLPAFVDGAGEIQLQNTVAKSVNEDGRKIDRGFFLKPEDADKFAKRARARGGKAVERKVPDKIVVDTNYTQGLFFAFSPTTRKMAAKIALSAVAFECGIPFALSRDFDLLRQARTAAGERDLRVWIFANEGLMGAFLRSLHQHSVLCYMSAEWRKAWAIVTLFGGISYRVDVSMDYSGREKQFSIFYDAVSRERIRPVVLADEKTLVGHVISPATKFEDREAVDAQWCPIVSAFCASKGIKAERIVGPIS